MRAVDTTVRLTGLRRARAIMIDYLDLRRQLQDWHGVQDAASDIREIDAQIRLLEGLASK